MVKKILIATGGTGGHIYPAIALAQQCLEESKYEVLFIGGELSKNRYFDRTAFDFRSISCGSFANRSPLSLFKSFWNITKGIWESRAVIRDFKPDVVVGFGSYYSFPPLIAAKLQSVPFILHEANSIPGKVNKLLAPYAFAIGVHFPFTLAFVKGSSFEVGMPLRKGFGKGKISTSDARRYFGMSNEGRFLLVFGGSQGASRINLAVTEALKLLQDPKSFQVVHIAGDAEQVKKLQLAYRECGISACVKAFEEHMELAWQAADMVISRSGAGSIAEQLEFEVPGILIPFLRAADNHQYHNASFLVDVVGGAKILQEKELTAQALAALMEHFLENEGANMEKMRQRMNGYKTSRRSSDLFSLIKAI